MIRPCVRPECTEIYNESLPDDAIPFVRVYVGKQYLSYCCPRCASIDINERYFPRVLP